MFMQTENLVENLLGDFEYEVQKPYLLYRNASQEVNGIWFYNPKECEDVANLFSRYAIFLNNWPNLNFGWVAFLLGGLNSTPSLLKYMTF